ncbi:MBL fold metallo-hydrolase [Streptomyces hyaluromycini]|uniref:MBL fold metallo-hydrolase n=1 Tax=Streptomyces hyaluromycini TaxID=1377993 RepID=UPI000B5C6149|nr:MBL fold metallo-hydrolase [Streptomyces hyaluromycini]
MSSSSASGTDRRSFLARVAAATAVPAAAALVAGGTATTASAATVHASAAGSSDAGLPDYAPVPAGSLGPAVNSQGYYVGRVQRNLYWVTDGDYQAAFLTTRDGVVLFDAPPTIGHNLQRAVDEIAAANGTSNKVTHIVHSHHHSDHVGASGLFGRHVVRIGHEENRRLLLRDNNPNKPAPDITFADRYTLHVGGERVELAYHGTNHAPDNIYIRFPHHDTLMLVDITIPGWAPFGALNYSEDIQGYLAAPAKALSYPWKHHIAGHMGRLGTRADVTVHQQYIDDLTTSIKQALGTVDYGVYAAKYGNNIWAVVKTWLDEVCRQAAAPVAAKYTGTLAAADVFTESSAFSLVESLRLDLGLGSAIHD